MSLEDKIENDTLRVYLEESSIAKINKALKAEDKRLRDLGIKDADKRRSTGFTVEYMIKVKGKEEKHFGCGETLEAAIEDVKSKFPYKITKAVERTYRANIAYKVKKNEAEKYKKKKKPSAAPPLVTGYPTFENVFY